MKSHLKYAWSKRGKLRRKRGVVARTIGRQAIRVQYRVWVGSSPIFHRSGLPIRMA